MNGKSGSALATSFPSQHPSPALLRAPPAPASGGSTAGSRGSVQLSRDEEARLGGAHVKLGPCAGAAGSARPCLGSGVTATIQDALVARLAGISTWAEEMSFRGKDPRRSLLSLWVHLPSLPYPDSERDTHTKTFDTLLIYSRFLPLSQWATSCRTPE